MVANSLLIRPYLLGGTGTLKDCIELRFLLGYPRIFSGKQRTNKTHLSEKGDEMVSVKAW